MRAHLLPSLKGLISNAHPLRLTVSEAISKAAVYAKRTANGSGGYSAAAVALEAFLKAAIAANLTFTRAASLANVLNVTTVSTTARRASSTVTATWPDGQTEVLVQPATGTVVIAVGNAANGNTVTINGKTYTFQTVLTNVDGNVLIGVDNAATAANLSAAMNLGTGSGTVYAAATTATPNVYATVSTSTVTLLSHGIDHTQAAFAVSRVGANITVPAALTVGKFDPRVTFASSDATKVTAGTYGTVTWVATGSANLTATFHGRTDVDAITAS